MLVLLAPIQGSVFEERDCKKNTVTASGTGRGKIVFISRNKVVEIYVKLTLINFRGPGFESPL